MFETKENLRVLLINPIYSLNLDEFTENINRRKVNADEPIGIMYISSWIKKTMPIVKIEIYDHHIECLRHTYEAGNVTKNILIDLLKDKLVEYRPDIVGISAQYHLSVFCAHETAQVVKEVAQNTVVVMGGFYPTTSPDSALQDHNVDFIIPGEGELPFQELLQYHLGEKQLDELSSIGYRASRKSEITFRKNGPIINNLNDLGFPDRETLPIGKYSIYGRTLVDRFYKSNSVVAAIQPTRGCPFTCTFCSGHVITSRRHRTREVSSVIKEIKYLKEQYGAEVIGFNDENSSVNPKWWIELYDAMIKEKLNIRWVSLCGFYVPLMSEELIAKAIESGVIMFNLAIESGSPRVQRMVKKSEKIIELAPQVIQTIRKYDPSIYVEGFFVTGFPFETREEMNMTFTFAEKLDLDWGLFNVFQPIHGCELQKYCIDHGHLLPVNFSYDTLENNLVAQLINTPVPPNEIEEMNYYANLSMNFVNSRTLRTRNFKQAVKDYSHVANIAPEHILAHWCLAKAYDGLNETNQAERERKIVSEIVEKNPKQLAYMRHFGLM